ncbi:MAG: HTH-type transcriptional activator IlvY, partial [Natronospirillum sp.]
MDLKALRLFLALAQDLHFGKAAAHTFVSPSTLSRVIARMEDELGVILFERDNRTVKLTAAGRQTRLRAETMVQEWEALRAELQQTPQTLRGQIRLYCSVTASYSLLIDLLQDFRPRYPRVDVVVDTGDAAHALDKVLADETDLAIAPRPDKIPAAIEFGAFATSPLCFIGPVVGCPVTEQLQAVSRDWAQLPFVVAEHGLA